MDRTLLIHGGVGSGDSLSPFLNEVARKCILSNELESVINAVVMMEDDPRFNAGTGSYHRIDGSIQMDASVMLPGRFGAVVAIENVKNPVLVARDVMEKSPHLILAGEGAVKFARLMGHEHYNPETEKSRKAMSSTLEKLADYSNMEDRITSFRNRVDFKKYLSADTVGAVSRFSGRFAGAVSTGGASPMLPGRVGDVPIPGAGIYVGDQGAVVATGIGEEIIQHSLCFRIYERIGEGSLQDVILDEVSGFKGPVGVIAMSSREEVWHANKTMSTGLFSME